MKACRIGPRSGGLGRRAARPAPPAAAGGGATGIARFLHQSGSLIVRSVDETGPPLAQFRRGLLGVAPDQQEIISGPQPEVFQKAQRGLAGPALEAWLQRPDLAHVGGETPLDGQ